ncbi:MAG: cell division protein DedD [Vibrio sp.]
MASKFQSRLIGTILVVAIGVIVLPDVLDGKKEHYEEDLSAIPLNPNAQATGQDNPAKQPQAMVELDGVAQSEQASSEPANDVANSTQQDDKSIAASESKSASEPNTPAEPKKPQPEPKTEPEVVAKVEPKPAAKPKPVEKPTQPQYQDSAWMIQLVALRNQENAKKLAADLKSRGYQVEVKVQGGVSRVIVGPDVSRDKMLKQIQELEKITGLKGQLRKFKPFN